MILIGDAAANSDGAIFSLFEIMWRRPGDLSDGVGSLFFTSLIGNAISSPDNSIFNRMLSLALFRCFGKYSYAIYLFHGSVIECLRPFVFSSKREEITHVNLLQELLFAFGVAGYTILIAYLSWHWCENPFLQLKK